MLAKKPSQRITIREMKQHPFFEAINWDLLQRKLITPPIILTMDEDDDGQREGVEPEDEEEAMFLNQTGATKEQDLFKDNDYS